MLTSRREFLAIAAASALSAPAAGAPPPLARKDSFFGLHFDLHPQKSDTALGRDLTEDMVERLLDRVRPDYVQYDSKGHAGYLGFPSKTGYSTPGIVNDSLALWRRVTARRGVALYNHFSGVWDSLAVERHPEWARVRPDGKPELNQTSTFGPYVDELMIPELDEAASRYALDGAWVDGECWAANPDCSEAARRAFGGGELPRSPKDARWNEFLELNREQFRRYVRHYVDELHRRHPKFQIASNWLYSTFVPERPDLPVDYLSGDYLGANSISTAHLEARYLAATGKPWDLMAWGFFNPKSGDGFLHKPAVQLQQEASVVLAQGGGFQIYYVPTRAGHIDDRHIDTAATVARFCRQRQSLSHRTAAVPQVGVLFSKHSLYRTSNKLFGSWGAWSDPARGMIDALLASHHSVDVIPDWKLAEVATQYPLIVVPDWLDIGDEAHAAVRAYVEGGGNALVCGAANGALFAADLGVKAGAAAVEKQPAWIPSATQFANVRGLWLDVEAQAATAVEQRHADSDSASPARVAATMTKLRAGKIGAIYGPAGAVYAATNTPALRDFIDRMARRLYTPLVELTAPPVIEVALRRQGEKLLVHLANLAGMPVSEERSLTDFVPPVGPLELQIRTPKPSAVTWEPAGTKPAWTWRGGVLTVKVERLEVHGIVAIS